MWDVGEWSWLAWNNGGEIWESGNTPDRVVVRNYQIGRPFFSFLFLFEPVYRYKSISASRIWKISIDFKRRRNVDEYSMKILITIIDNNSFISPYKRRRKKEELIYTLQVDTIKFVSLRCINIVTANVSRSTLILRFNFTVLISLPVFCGFFQWDWIIKYCGRGREGDTGLCGLLFLIFVNWTIPSVRLTVHMHICGIYIYINMRERERKIRRDRTPIPLSVPLFRTAKGWRVNETNALTMQTLITGGRIDRLIVERVHALITRRPAADRANRTIYC